jgi:hypothetical protein
VHNHSLGASLTGQQLEAINEVILATWDDVDA